MAGLFDFLNGGFTPMNAQGAQPPLGFMEALGQNRTALTGLGLGLMGGSANDMYGPALRGYEAGARTDAVNQYRQQQLRQAAAERDYQRTQDRQAQSNWERAFKQRADLSKGATTNDIMEYQYAKNEGFTGTFPEWMTRKQSATTDKAPAGYAWNVPGDPSKGQYEIAGGPATKLPSETAGRLAMMQAAKPGLEEAKKYFLDEKRNVLTDDAGAGGAAGGMVKQNIGAATGSFEIGRQQRNVRIAIESALRVATGAAAPDKEVDRYEAMFSPSIYDTLKTRQQKLKALDAFISNAERNITQGRGGAQGGQPRQPDPWGIR